MLDISHIPSQQQSTFILYTTGDWQTFVKPRNAKFIEIFCLGGGGGGGHCTINAAGSAGAGAGGSSGIVRGIIPAFLLPDTLYIQVGKGGAGAKTSGGGGSTGGISYVGLQPLTSEQTLVCKSSTAGATGGLASGTAGSAGSVSVPALSAFGNLGLFTAIAGINGSSGGNNTGAAGTSQTALASNITTGGVGGGGKTASVFGAGGSINAAPVILTSTVLGGVASGQDGENGYGTLQPFCGTGGSGGAGRSGTTLAGGKGGNGFYGCGGGGGGGASATGGFGGDGGDGLVIITVIS
jgi:hypothetical protein